MAYIASTNSVVTFDLSTNSVYLVSIAKTGVSGAGLFIVSAHANNSGITVIQDTSVASAVFDSSNPLQLNVTALSTYIRVSVIKIV